MATPSPADRLFVALWQRNATRLGWLKYAAWKPLLKHHLGPALTDRQYRSAFSTLQRCGHFLECRVAPNQHRSYIFIQRALPLDDHEARAAAVSRLRWSSEYLTA
jgi:hypothetical protein